MTEIHGVCEDEFEPVRDGNGRELRPGQRARGERRSVTVAGEPVVDLWAGDADEQGRPWERDTIVNVYSTTKTMAATCVLMLADRGHARPRRRR